MQDTEKIEGNCKKGGYWKKCRETKKCPKRIKINPVKQSYTQK
jgi:hypothetical protein